MKRLLAIVLCFVLTLAWCYSPVPSTSANQLYIETPSVEQCYVGKVTLNNRLTVRLLVLKHCRENIATSDATGIIKAANLAATKGLSIKELGQHHVTKEGRLQWGAAMTLEGLKDFVSDQMKISAKIGDTFIIYTVGHGSGSGSIQILGDREPVARAFAAAAAENRQECLWWQLSCHAAAGLPELSSFTSDEQKVFSMIASSPANKLSYFHDQAKLMEGVFLALAEESSEIDPDGDGIVVARELAAFLENLRSGNGKLVFAISEDEPIFGWFNYVNFIPIHLPDGRPIPFPEDFIPLP